MSCKTCLFREKGKCVWMDMSITSRPLCAGVHWQEKPDHMYAPPEERVFPFQLDDMTPEERRTAKEAQAEAKKKAISKMVAFLHQLELAEMAQAQAGVFRMWFRNFLDWKLGQRDVVTVCDEPLRRAA